jgi:hypothetical protein
MNVMQRVGGSIGTALLAVVLSHQMTLITSGAGTGGAGIQAMQTMTPEMRALVLPALGTAFGHTFVWSLGITVLGLVAASFLPRRKLTKPQGEEAAAATLMD